MTECILVADIGGTKSWLALYTRQADESWKLGQAEKLANRSFDSPAALLYSYLDRLAIDPACIRHAGLAVAGPVAGESVELTNLPWKIETKRLSAQLDLDQLLLINDFQAAARGISLLTEPDLVSLNSVSGKPDDVVVITGAGTGLGLAWLDNYGGEDQVHPTEAGHADFAPASELQQKLLQYLQQHQSIERVSWEHLLSGQGLVLIDAFMRNARTQAGKSPDEITAMAEEHDATALGAIRLFWDIYAAWAGNVALLYRPGGGIYLFGGMAMRLYPWLDRQRFLDKATDRGGMQSLVKQTPMSLITDERLALKGAAVIVKEKFF